MKVKAKCERVSSFFSFRLHPSALLFFRPDPCVPQRVTIQVAESDSLRDEDEADRRKLDEDGVKFTTVRYHGMIHDFGLLNGSAEETAIHSSFEQAAQGCLDRDGRYRKEGAR
jgi:acetyl esterase/lipase